MRYQALHNTYEIKCTLLSSSKPAESLSVPTLPPTADHVPGKKRLSRATVHSFAGSAWRYNSTPTLVCGVYRNNFTQSTYCTAMWERGI